MAFGREPVPRLASDVRLGAPDEPARRDLVDDAIGRLRRLAEELDLLGVLRHPQLPRNGGSPLEANAGQLRLEPEDVARPERVVHPDRPPTALRAAGHRRGDEPVRVLGLLPGHDLDEPAGDRRRPAGRILLQPGDDHDEPSGRPDDEHRQPLEGHRGVAGEVAQVGADADEQGPEPSLAGDPGRRLESLAEALGRDARAGGGICHGRTASSTPLA